MKFFSENDVKEASKQGKAAESKKQNELLLSRKYLALRSQIIRDLTTGFSFFVKIAKEYPVIAQKKGIAPVNRCVAKNSKRTISAYPAGVGVSVGVTPYGSDGPQRGLYVSKHGVLLSSYSNTYGCSTEKFTDKDFNYMLEKSIHTKYDNNAAIGNWGVNLYLGNRAFILTIAKFVYPPECLSSQGIYTVINSEPNFEKLKRQRYSDDVIKKNIVDYFMSL